MEDTTRKTAPHAIDVPYIERAADGGLGYLDLKQNPDVDIVARIASDRFTGGDTALVVGPDDKILGSAAVLAPVESVAVLIPAKTLLELGDGTHLIRSRVRDADGSEFDSAPSELVIKLTVPGDLDTVVSTPYINENLVVPTIVPRPIDPATP
ncbi:hypothetical protein SAMN02800694_3721, partial [Luteibacter sp. UNCMF331Sha3.1]|uniref:hypothetical protein n=1 Tax=Luteibacter sp. UNCMF331Sha3.1 TaxID=1502760 RepID=UPI0008CD6D00